MVFRVASILSIEIPLSQMSEKHPFIGKQSQIADRKTVGEQGPGDRSKEVA